MRTSISCRCALRPSPLGRRDALLLLASLGVGTDAVQAQDATKVEPRSYRVLLENAKVRVLEYVGHPGLGVCGAGMHSHPDHVAIALTPAKVKVTQDGKTSVHDIKAGTAIWDPAATHMAENVGGSGSRFILVEIKDRDWKPATG
jgi:hypothetical protein